jgi:acetoin utilization deacetylase AcuC-like enzyme
MLETADFARMACHVRDLAASLGAPVGAVLEGYDLGALADSVIATLKARSGVGELESIAPDPILTSRAAAQFGRYWRL